jgi:hypothetical protein
MLLLALLLAGRAVAAARENIGADVVDLPLNPGPAASAENAWQPITGSQAALPRQPEGLGDIDAWAALLDSLAVLRSDQNGAPARAPIEIEVSHLLFCGSCRWCLACKHPLNTRLATGVGLSFFLSVDPEDYT